jgi:hypothetical protein
MHIAVVARQRFRQCAHTGDFVPSDVAQRFQPLPGQHANKGIPALEGEMVLAEGLAALGPAPGVDKAARRIPLEIAADRVLTSVISYPAGSIPVIYGSRVFLRRSLSTATCSGGDEDGQANVTG